MCQIGKFLIWQSLPNSLNHQIKNLAKVTRYIICGILTCVYELIGCVQFSGGIGLHSYICTVEARPANGSSVNFTNKTITPAGRELLFFMLISVCKYILLLLTHNCSTCVHQ